MPQRKANSPISRLVQKERTLRAAAQLLEPLRMCTNGLSLLATIRDHQPAKAGRLAEELFLTKQHVNLSLACLLSRHLIEQQPEGITLTLAGEGLLEAAEHLLGQTLFQH